MSHILTAYADTERVQAIQNHFGTHLEQINGVQKYLLLCLLAQYCFVQFDGEDPDPDFTFDACLELSQIGQHADATIASIWLTLEGASEPELQGVILAISSQLFDGEYARLHPKSAALTGR